jgi:hypothetical protein
MLYVPPFWLHRAEAGPNASVSVSSWFDDPWTQQALTRSAQLPLLPFLPTHAEAAAAAAAAAAGGSPEGQQGQRQLGRAVAVLWEYLGGLGGGRQPGGTLLGRQLWEQRYRPLGFGRRDDTADADATGR